MASDASTSTLSPTQIQNAPPSSDLPSSSLIPAKTVEGNSLDVLQFSTSPSTELNDAEKQSDKLPVSNASSTSTVASPPASSAAVSPAVAPRPRRCRSFCSFPCVILSFFLFYLLAFLQNLYSTFNPSLPSAPQSQWNYIQPYRPLLGSPEDKLNIEIYLHNKAQIPRYSHALKPEQRIFSAKNLTISSSHSFNISLNLSSILSTLFPSSTFTSSNPHHVIYSHIFAYRSQFTERTKDEKNFHRVVSWTKWLKDEEKNEERQLITASGQNTTEIIKIDKENGKTKDNSKEKETKKQSWSQHWRDQIPLVIVQDFHSYPPRSFLEDISSFYSVDDSTRTYFPLLLPFDGWLTRENHFNFYNFSSKQPVDIGNITINIQPISVGFFRFSLQMFQSLELMEMMLNSFHSSSESANKEDLPDHSEECDEIRRLFTDTDHTFLLLTFVVSIVHLALDVLAFQSDIRFWRSRQSFIGISVQTVLLSFTCQIIIVLYLIEEGASKLVLFSTVSNMLITLWKLVKVLRLSVNFRPAIFFISIRLGDVPKSEVATRRHEDAIMRIFYMLLLPCVCAYGVYSLIYAAHRSWWAWLLKTLASGVYGFGFVSMLPQLILNYRLKSVSSLPMSVFIYRFFNTIIDDLFAFLIRMPTMHRVAVFRDDVVFLIYCFQRWIYPTDPNRMAAINEEPEDKIDEHNKQQKPRLQNQNQPPEEQAAQATTTKKEEKETDEQLEKLVEENGGNEVVEKDDEVKEKDGLVKRIRTRENHDEHSESDTRS